MRAQWDGEENYTNEELALTPVFVFLLITAVLWKI